MSRNRRETFSDLMEKVIDEHLGIVFPVREELSPISSGVHITRVLWHQYISEEEAFKLSKIKDLNAEQALSYSLCGRYDLSKAELPRRIKRGAMPILCETCVKFGEYSVDELNEAAFKIINEAHKLQDAKY